MEKFDLSELNFRGSFCSSWRALEELWWCIPLILTKNKRSGSCACPKRPKPIQRTQAHRVTVTRPLFFPHHIKLPCLCMHVCVRVCVCVCVRMCKKCTCMHQCFIKGLGKPWFHYQPPFWEFDKLGSHIDFIVLPQPAGRPAASRHMVNGVCKWIVRFKSVASTQQGPDLEL